MRWNGAPGSVGQADMLFFLTPERNRGLPRSPQGEGTAMLAILVLYGALTPAAGQTGVSAEQILAAYTRAQDEIHGLVVHFASEWHAEHNMTHVPT